MKNIFHNLSLLAIIFIVSCTSNSNDRISNNKLTFYCDAEVVSGNKFIYGNHKFNNGKTQSSEMSFSGRSSCLLNKKRVYGFSTAISNIKTGDTLIVSCMRFSDFGYGVVAISDGKEFYKEIRNSIKVKKWDSLHTRFVIPPSYNNKQIKVYPYFKKGEKVFFDDLRVEVIKAIPKSIEPYNVAQIKIDISDENMSFLKIKRLEALNKGSLKKDGKVYVKAKVDFNGKSLKAKVRLKGDLLDHIESDKWSFRVKLNKKDSINGMRSFSVHNAKSRDFLNEWLFHRILDNEDILNTYYEFIELSINGSPKGIYALESTFDNSIFKRRGIGPKPIIRINEDGIWNNSSRGLTEYGSLAYISSEIKGFKSQNHNDSISFKKAKKLLENYKQGSLTVDQAFDINHLAKYIAIVDLCKAHHALRWQNIRCYLDPKSQKLRIIGFDGYGPEGPMGINKPFLGYHVSGICDPYTKGEDCFLDAFYQSNEFVSKYNFYLNKFSNKLYIDKLINGLSKDISDIEKTIKTSYDDYTYSYNFLTKNANDILKYLIPMKEVTIKAYRDKKGIKVISYGPTFIKLLADKNGWNNDKIIKSYVKGRPADTILVPMTNSKEIFYSVLGIDSIYSEKILKQ